MATIAATETQLSQQTKPTGMYDQPRSHKRLLVKDRTWQAEDAKNEHGSCLLKTEHDKQNMPKDKHGRWQEDTAIIVENRSRLKSPMKANCNGGTEIEAQSACMHMKARFGTWEPTRRPQEKKAVSGILHVIKWCQGFEACCHRH